MCFVLVLRGVHPRWPLVVAANRDERRSRPSRPPFRWEGDPALWAGRDEVASGTWLGVNAHGVLAAVTNRRGYPTDPSLPSRGQLCLAMLRQPTPDAARRALEAALGESRYNPFNLLVADARDGWLADWTGDIRSVEPGVHVVSSLGAPDDETLAPVRRAHALYDGAEIAALERLLGDTDGPDPICRVGGEYGTVSSSIIALDETGRVALYRHADGPPATAPFGDVATA